MKLVAFDIKKILKSYEKQNLGKNWRTQELLIGLMTDLGDLSRLILEKEGFRKKHSLTDQALKHELADCLWVIIILAEKYQVSLEDALIDLRQDLHKKINN